MHAKNKTMANKYIPITIYISLVCIYFILNVMFGFMILNNNDAHINIPQLSGLVKTLPGPQRVIYHLTYYNTPNSVNAIINTYTFTLLLYLTTITIIHVFIILDVNILKLIKQSSRYMLMLNVMFMLFPIYVLIYTPASLDVNRRNINLIRAIPV